MVVLNKHKELQQLQHQHAVLQQDSITVANERNHFLAKQVWRKSETETASSNLDMRKQAGGKVAGV